MTRPTPELERLKAALAAAWAEEASALASARAADAAWAEARGEK